jgi:hypothetical protein
MVQCWISCLSDWNIFALDYRNAKSEVLTMVTVKVGVLWNVMPCILVKFYRLSGGGGAPFASVHIPGISVTLYTKY